MGHKIEISAFYCLLVPVAHSLVAEDPDSLYTLPRHHIC